jgi:phosphoglycerate-specific signal transduction histidine kinase
MPLNAAEQRSSLDALLPRVLHEFAQPLSALACCLDLTLMEDADLARYHQALEHAVNITQRLSERVAYFRELNDALQPCDCPEPVDAAGVVEGAVEQVRELANLLAIEMELDVDSVSLSGEFKKFRFALVRLFDEIFQIGKPAVVRLLCDGDRCGEIRIEAAGEPKQLPGSRAWELARAALASVGAELRIEAHGRVIEATVAACAYKSPEATPPAVPRRS